MKKPFLKRGLAAISVGVTIPALQFFEQRIAEILDVAMIATVTGLNRARFSARALVAILLLVAGVMGGTTPVQAVPIVLTALDATVSPVGSPGGAFPAIDVSNLFGGGAGSVISLQPKSVTLLTGSGIPGAGQGSVDLAIGGAFNLNWAFDAKLDVLQFGVLVGTAEVQAVLPETGSITFIDPATMTFHASSQTSGFVPAGMLLSGLGGPTVAVGKITNINIVIVNATSADMAEGLFANTIPPMPAIQFQLPDLLGGATLPVVLEGTFELAVPEPMPLTLVAIAGLIGIMFRRRTRLDAA